MLAALFALALNLMAGRARSGLDEIEEGLSYAEFEAPRKADDGDSIIRVLRVDPARFSIQLYSALEPREGRRLRSVRDWAQEKGLAAAINASMFQEDGLTSVGYMKKAGFTVNGHLNKNQSLILFDPREGSGLSEVKMADLDEVGAPELEKYRGAVQSIRLLGKNGEALWREEDKRWPAALIGMDGKGRILLIHVKSSYSMKELTGFLLALPLDLKKLQYAEGGSEAQLFVNSGAFQGYFAPPSIQLEVPNVLGFRRK